MTPAEQLYDQCLDEFLNWEPDHLNEGHLTFYHLWNGDRWPTIDDVSYFNDAATAYSEAEVLEL